MWLYKYIEGKGLVRYARHAGNELKHQVDLPSPLPYSHNTMRHPTSAAIEHCLSLAIRAGRVTMASEPLRKFIARLPMTTEWSIRSKHGIFG
jgi:hypothetical protein